jgi:hypothetical protein
LYDDVDRSKKGRASVASYHYKISRRIVPETTSRKVTFSLPANSCSNCFRPLSHSSGRGHVHGIVSSWYSATRPYNIVMLIVSMVHSRFSLT